jgi:hypothetical protein
MISVISIVTGVIASLIRVKSIEQHSPQRRLLISSVRVEFTIEVIPRTTEEPAQETSTTAQTIAALLSPETINQRISQNYLLREFMPDGAVVLQVGVINAVPAQDIDPIYIVIGLVVVLLVAMMLCACAFTFFCKRPRENTATLYTDTQHGVYVHGPGMSSAGPYINTTERKFIRYSMVPHIDTKEQMI